MKTSERIMEFIIDYMTKNQYSPSVAEIMDAVGLASPNTVQYHLENLAVRGEIKYNGKRKITVRGYKFGKDSRYQS